MSTQDWARNLTGTDDGIFRTTNGTADELIAIGRTIKAGFNCAGVNIPNSRYDAVIDIGGRLLRIQIKGVGPKPPRRVSFKGGGRSGEQIDRRVASREYKYTQADCDILMAIDSTNGDCYIIPIEAIKAWGDTKALSKLGEYKENWGVFSRYANDDN